MQLSTIATNQGRAWPAPATLWDNSAVIGAGTAVVSDAPKRDRNVWPGDLGIATPTAYASTNEMESSRNALTTLYNMQRTSGELPCSGPPFNLWGSDTYHLWTLNVTSTYYGYTADRAWLDSVWSRFTRGMSYITNKIDSSGLLNVTNTADWARNGQGGLNLQANALLYATLTGASRLDGTAKACYLPPAGGPADGWTQCAAENGTCPAAAGQPVAYGADGAFAIATATGDMSCTNATFGDPIANTAKACYTRTGGPNGYGTACATENGTCTFTGTQTVAYGARGAYIFRSFTGSTACTTAAFGRDPLFGVQKSCYLT